MNVFQGSLLAISPSENLYKRGGMEGHGGMEGVRWMKGRDKGGRQEGKGRVCGTEMKRYSRPF